MNINRRILITGADGFIGSHACVALAQTGHELAIIDNLCNSRADVIGRLAQLYGKRPAFQLVRAFRVRTPTLMAAPNS